MSNFKKGDILRIIEPPFGMEHSTGNLVRALSDRNDGFVNILPQKQEHTISVKHYTWYVYRFKLVTDPSELLKEFL